MENIDVEFYTNIKLGHVSQTTNATNKIVYWTLNSIEQIQAILERNMISIASVELIHKLNYIDRKIFINSNEAKKNYENLDIVGEYAPKSIDLILENIGNVFLKKLKSKHPEFNFSNIKYTWDVCSKSIHSDINNSENQDIYGQIIIDSTIPKNIFKSINSNQSENRLYSCKLKNQPMKYDKVHANLDDYLIRFSASQKFTILKNNISESEIYYQWIKKLEKDIPENFEYNSSICSTMESENEYVCNFKAYGESFNPHQYIIPESKYTIEINDQWVELSEEKIFSEDVFSEIIMMYVDWMDSIDENLNTDSQYINPKMEYMGNEKYKVQFITKCYISQMCDINKIFPNISIKTMSRFD